LFAAATFVAATALRGALAPWLGVGTAAFEAYFLGVVFVAHIAGHRPALAFALVSATAGTWLFFESSDATRWIAAALAISALLAAALLASRRNTGSPESSLVSAGDRAALGHELRNPLTAISTAAYLLGRPQPMAVIEQHRLTILRQAQRLARVVDELIEPPVHAATATRMATDVPFVALIRGRVLIVDDEVESADALRCYLELERHEVRLARDAREALAVVRGWQPDVVICDLGLPAPISGCELARRLIANGLDAPLIAFSGYGSRDDIAAALAVGFSRHITKPSSPHEIARHVQAALFAGRLERPKPAPA